MPELAIHPLRTRDEAEACARMMAATDPWLTLGRDFDASLGMLLDENRERYVAYAGERLAGFVILNMKGAFVGYIQTVCVDAGLRGHGTGSALIAFAESRIFREQANVFMCVSTFNRGAQKLYERLGYQVVGELTDYIVRGHGEILMRKSRGPIAGYRGEGQAGASATGTQAARSPEAGAAAASEEPR